MFDIILTNDGHLQTQSLFISYLYVLFIMIPYYNFIYCEKYVLL